MVPDQQAHQRMFGDSQDLRDLDDGNDCSSHRRPEARDEKKSRCRKRGRSECQCNGGSLHSVGPARTRRTEPTTRRMSSKPMPGQLPANVE